MSLSFTHTEDKIQPVQFGGKVDISTIQLKISDFQGFGGSISLFYPEDKTKESDGVETATKGYYKAVVRSSRWINDPWHMNGGYWDTRSNTMITVKVDWTPYTAAPVKPSPIQNTVENSEQGYNQQLSPDNEIEAPYGEEYTEVWKLIAAGFNYKCVDFYDRDYLGMGERRAKKNIFNGLIPNLAAAKRVGSNEIFKTGKKRTEYWFDIPPNLEIKSGRTIRGIRSSQNLNHNIFLTKRKIEASTNKQSYQVFGIHIDRSK